MEILPPLDQRANKGEPTKFTAYTTMPVNTGIGEIKIPTGLSASFDDVLLVFL